MEKSVYNYDVVVVCVCVVLKGSIPINITKYFVPVTFNGHINTPA